MQDNSDLIIRDCCEAEVAEFGQPDTICITVDVLREIVQRHSPGTCLHQITEPQAAPAAVAVPEERAAFNKWWGTPHLWSHGHKEAQWSAWQARAALAATPAAAPVVHGPDAWRDGAKFALKAVSEVDSLCWLTDNMKEVCIRLAADAVIAERDRQRALLAGVSAPAAVATEQAPVLYVSKGQLDNHRDPDGPKSFNAGRYLPARITPAGKFITPLFAVPQARDASNEWQDISTLPTCDDLIWLYCQDTNTVDGPVAPSPIYEDSWTHWAYAEAPSTASINRAAIAAAKGE